MMESHHRWWSCGVTPKIKLVEEKKYLVVVPPAAPWGTLFSRWSANEVSRCINPPNYQYMTVVFQLQEAVGWRGGLGCEYNCESKQSPRKIQRRLSCIPLRFSLKSKHHYLFFCKNSTTTENIRSYSVKSFGATLHLAPPGAAIYWLRIVHFDPHSGELGDAFTVLEKMYSRSLSLSSFSFERSNPALIDWVLNLLRHLVKKSS